MTWTPTPPTEPGFHWWHRVEELKRTTIVEVVTHYDRLFMQLPGDDSLYELDDFDALWGDRIETPKAP